MNDENLVTLAQRTKSAQREIQSKGGKVSARKRRERKTIAEALRAVLDEPLAKGSRKTKLDGITMKAIKKMFDDPDIKDLETLSKIIGEFKNTTELTGSVELVKPTIVFRDEPTSE